MSEMPLVEFCKNKGIKDQIVRNYYQKKHLSKYHELQSLIEKRQGKGGRAGRAGAQLIITDIDKFQKVFSSLSNIILRRNPGKKTNELKPAIIFAEVEGFNIISCEEIFCDLDNSQYRKFNKAKHKQSDKIGYIATVEHKGIIGKAAGESEEIAKQRAIDYLLRDLKIN